MRDNLPSITAFLVADGLLELSRDRQHGFIVPRPQIPVLVAFAEQWRAARADWIASHKDEFEKLRAPATEGILQHYAARKRLIGGCVEEAIARGCTTVVNIGAGFDTLSLRLKDEYPQVCFIEIDHPPTQAVKQKALTDAERAKIDWLGADLSQDRLGKILEQRINEQRINPDEKTIYIMEGLTAYLSEEQVKGMLADIRVLSGQNAELVIGVLSQPPHQADSTLSGKVREVNRSLAQHGEGYTYGVPYSAMRGDLRRSGFSLKSSWRMGDLQRGFRPAEECEAINAQPLLENYYLAASHPQALPDMPRFHGSTAPEIGVGQQSIARD